MEEFTTDPRGIYQWSRRNLPLVQGGILQWSRPTSSVVNSSFTTEEFLHLRNRKKTLFRTIVYTLSSSSRPPRGRMDVRYMSSARPTRLPFPDAVDTLGAR